MQESSSNTGIDPQRLPTFIIGGARKCGTTSLWSYLQCHPDIGMGEMKEPQFFSRQAGRVETGDHFGPPRGGTFDRGWAWYADQFKGLEHYRVRGEASTMYFDAPDSAALLADAMPDVKVIFCLRHPVDRIYSHYWYDRQFEQLPTFEDMVVRRHRRLEWYVHQSHYSDHLARFYQHVPDSNVHIVVTSELSKSPRRTVGEVCAFLGVDPGRLPATEPVHRNTAGASRSVALQRLLAQHRSEWSRFVPSQLRGYARAGKDWVLTRNVRSFQYPRMDARTRAELLALFLPDVEAVEAVTGRDLSSWRR